MRFALAATSIAAAVAVPLAFAAGGPSMSDGQFLNTVRCVAYEDARGRANLDPIKSALIWETARQSDETVAQARAEIGEVARSETARQAAGAACVAMLDANSGA